MMACVASLTQLSAMMISTLSGPQAAEVYRNLISTKPKRYKKYTDMLITEVKRK